MPDRLLLPQQLPRAADHAADEPLDFQAARAGWPCVTPSGLRLRLNAVAPSPKQAGFLALVNREVLFGGAGGGGKALELSTAVLSTKGWTTIGDLEVGDVVFDHNGEPTRVLWKSPVETRKTYLVTLTDGEQIVASADHLWNVTTARQRMNYRRTDPAWKAHRRARRASRGREEAARAAISDGRAHGTAQAAVATNSRRAQEAREHARRPSTWHYTTTMTTEQIVALQGCEREKVAIPNGGPIRTGGAWRSAIPAYTLGAWLGDGSAREGWLCSAPADTPAMTAELEADGWHVTASERDQPNGGTINILRLRRADTGQTLTSMLRSEGLLGHKHVPDWVHLAPHADRQAFLGGFCDTDGYVDAERGRVEFCLAREDMVRDVWSLFWSIGETPTKVTRRRTRNQDPGFEGDAWRFQLSGCSSYLFRMPRKRERLAARSGRSARSEYRQIESIVEVDPVPVQCIQVDNPRGLYRAGRSHLTTHNSIALLMAALMFVDVPGYNALILRRTLQSLKLPNGLIDWSHRWLGDVPGATWNGNDYQWTFYTGPGQDPATLTFGYLSHAGSEDKYRSSELHYIGFDELSEFPWEDQYQFMFSRLRRAKNLHGAAPDGLTLDHVPLRVRGACVDEGEVLTVADGWKDIRDVKVGEFVYSVAQDGTLQPKKVTAHHAYDNDKPFVRVQMRNLSMSMTDDHRVTHLSFNSRHPGRRRYETLPYNEHAARCIDVARAPRSIEAPGYTGDPLGWGTEVYLAYLGLFLAEGSAPPERRGNYKVLVTQCDAVGGERVADLMSKVPLRSCRTAGGDFQITNKAAWEHFHRLGKAHEKYVPREVLSTATADQLRLLLDWLVFGDGHVRGESIQYVTCSPRLADDVAEIGFKLGYKVKVTRKELPNPNHNDRYTVYLTPGITTRVEKSGPRSPVTYGEFDGKVYCIEVADNHNFVLRQRGTVWVSGNTNPGGPGMPWVKRRFVAADTAKRPFLASLLTDNPGIDADEYRASLAELSEVERKRMEEGDWDAVEVLGALWRFKDFAWTDRMEPRPVEEVDVRAIGVDPSVSADTGKGDEVGIIMGSITSGTVTAELDLSGKMHPDDWSRVVVAAYHDYGCSSVIVEDNQGKALLHTALGNAADQLGVARPRLFVIPAKESKEARALPVAQAYRSTPKRVIHDLALKGGSLEAQLCLVAGTPVLTRRGWEPVETVAVGDEVLTRRGWRPVDWSGPTGRATTLTTVRTSSGQSFTCTPNHPVWVVGVGWVRADAVAQGDRLLGCHESPSWNTSSSPIGDCGSTPTHSPATAEVARRRSTTAPTSNLTAALCFTDSYGRTLTGQSRTATSSTTATATRSTTPSTTLSCSLAASTSATTSEDARPSTPTLTLRRSGPKRPGRRDSHAMSSAWLAGPSSSPPACEPCSAPVHVVAATTWTCEATDVYDLSVAGEHEFYAAGVLVHNTSWVPRRGDSPDRLDALVWLVRHLLYGEGKAAQYRPAPTSPQAARSSVATLMSGRMPGT